MRRALLLLPILAAFAPALLADDEATVTANSLNVRRGPSTDEPVLFQLARGDRVRVLARRGEWYSVEVGEGASKRQGWAHSGYVRLDPATVPEAPATREARLEFVLDVDRSALELLEDDGRRWLGFEWARNDYPGSPDGPNEGEARAIARRLAGMVPERRVNTGPHRLPFDYEKISAQWVPVPGREGLKLHRFAAESFDAMRKAAAADGVTLRVLSAARTLEHQKRLAASNSNPEAVAQGTSTHNYGLAIDLAMSPGAGREFEEITTRPFTNVIGMRSSPVYKWMFFFGAEHGWYPYHNEPWHWEYNPEGLADRFPG